MAKIPNTFAAVERYDLVRDEVDHRLDPVIPEDAVRHAVLLPEEPWTGIWAEIVDSSEPVFAKRHYGLDAACGRWFRAISHSPSTPRTPEPVPGAWTPSGSRGKTVRPDVRLADISLIEPGGTSHPPQVSSPGPCSGRQSEHRSGPYRVHQHCLQLHVTWPPHGKADCPPVGAQDQGDVPSGSAKEKRRPTAQHR